VRHYEPRAAEVDSPGTASREYKDVSIRGQTTIRLDDLDAGFAKELEQLLALALARDPDLRRANRTWAPEPVTIELDDETEIYENGRMDRPISPYGSVTEVEFMLQDERL
jgi:hypothetical protein